MLTAFLRRGRKLVQGGQTGSGQVGQHTRMGADGARAVH